MENALARVPNAFRSVRPVGESISRGVSWLLSNDPSLPAKLLSRGGRGIVSAKITGANRDAAPRFNALAKWTEPRGSFRRRRRLGPNRRR